MGGVKPEEPGCIVVEDVARLLGCEIVGVLDNESRRLCAGRPFFILLARWRLENISKIGSLVLGETLSQSRHAGV